MKEEIKNSIPKGNGTHSDALSTLADILIETDTENKKSQKKNLTWVIISTIISFLVLLISLFTIFFKK